MPSEFICPLGNTTIVDHAEAEKESELDMTVYFRSEKKWFFPECSSCNMKKSERHANFNETGTFESSIVVISCLFKKNECGTNVKHYTLEDLETGKVPNNNLIGTCPICGENERCIEKWHEIGTGCTECLEKIEIQPV